MAEFRGERESKGGTYPRILGGLENRLAVYGGGCVFCSPAGWVLVGRREVVRSWSLGRDEVTLGIIRGWRAEGNNPRGSFVRS